jgi:Tfp pilus assembly protein PilZ
MGGTKDRRYKRVDLQKGVTVVWQRGAQREVTRATTIGAGGLFIATRKPPPIGSVVQLLFEAPGGGKNIRATAVVRDMKPARGMGVAFTALSPDEKAQLDAVLKTLAEPGETSAEKPAAARPQKRRYPRIELPKGMKVAWSFSKKSEISMVRTLSVGGLFIATEDPAPVGSTMRLLFQVPGGEILVTAVVRDAIPGKGMGIEFTDLAPQERERLEGLMKKLLG